MNSPWISIVYVVVALVVLKWWIRDCRQYQVAGKPVDGALPGASPVAAWVVGIGVLVSLLILGVEIVGEYALGIVGEQKELLWYAIFPVLCAPIVEEVIFRGYLVVTNKGKLALWGSIVGFSILFSLIHGHLLTFGEEGESWLLWKGDTAKAWFTSAILFAQSLWWYFLRFCPWNPHRSILPSIVAHFAVNMGVVVTKGVQGYVNFNP